MKIGRNQPCPCGSGKKYKKCCLNKPVPAETFGYTDLDQLSNSVWEYIKAEKWDKAEDACRRLLEEYPDQIDGLHRSAELWEARKDAGKAAEYYKKAAGFAKKAGGFDQSTIDFFMQKAEQLAG